MDPRRKLFAGTLFFATLAVVVSAFLRPLDGAEWFALAASVVFVVLGCIALLMGAPSRKPIARRAVHARPRPTAPVPLPEPEPDAVLEEPTAAEQVVLETTLSALRHAGVLAVGDVDPSMLWRSAQGLDPGEPVDYGLAFDALVGLEDLGWARPRRLVFVPAHTEYDEELLAEVAAAILASLGHGIRESDISVALPRDRSAGPAELAFPLEGRRETIAFRYIGKYPPPELLSALAGFTRPDEPRDIVCANASDQTLVFAAIRKGALAELNARFPVEYAMFGPA
ncbi:MAG: hypothetical protein DI629_06655 [Mesorhizobium amorphae]|nr:MAG: hypothetical protein DI629_06655 [Mesorhizobium amorphae]